MRSAEAPWFAKTPDQLTASRDAWLSLGGRAFINFRAVAGASADEQCYEAVAGTITAERKLEFRVRFGDLTFCESFHLIRAMSFPALDRVTLVADRETTKGTVTRVFLFEASTGRKVIEQELAGNASGALPLGPDGLVVTFRSPDRIEVLPKPDPRLAGVAVDGTTRYDLPYVRARGPHGLVVFNVATAEVWNADPDPAHRWAYGKTFFSDRRLTFAVTQGTEQHVVTLPLVKGGAPVDLGSVPLSWKGPLWVAGDRAYFQSGWASPWSELLNVMSAPSIPIESPVKLSRWNDHLHQFAEPPSNGHPPGDIFFSDDVPSEDWELALDLNGPNTGSNPRCYEVPGKRQDPASRGPGLPSSLATLPKAKPCERAWARAAQKMEKVTMKPLATVRTPAQAAQYCMDALLSQRSTEMLRCLDLEGMLAGDEAEEDLTETTPDLAESIAWRMAGEAFDIVSHQARVALLRALAAGDGPSRMKLTGVTSKAFTATWDVGHGQKTATLRMTFARAGTAVRPRLPWLLKDAELKTPSGERKVFVAAGRLPNPQAQGPTPP